MYCLKLIAHKIKKQQHASGISPSHSRGPRICDTPRAKDSPPDPCRADLQLWGFRVSAELLLLCERYCAGARVMLLMYDAIITYEDEVPLEPLLALKQNMAVSSLFILMSKINQQY